MIRVLKFTLHDQGSALVPLPRGAKVLSVADQRGAVQLWVQADDKAPLESRHFATLYTGHDEVPHRGHFVGSVISQSGDLVRHVFEILREDS